MQKKSAYFLLIASVIPISMLYTNCGAPFGVNAANLSQSSAGDGTWSGDGSATGGVNVGAGSDAVPPVTTSTSSFTAPFTPAKTVTVCASGCDYSLPSQAFATAQDMELIKISAGSYLDCGTLPGSVANVWVKGVGGMAHMYLNSGTIACSKKGIIVADSTNVTIDNMELSGAAIDAGDGENGAGIRFEGTNLTVRNSDFHDNQNGILTNNSYAGDVHIQNSHFARNGQAGLEHDMYIGHQATFEIENSIIEQGYLGNVVKSRAAKSTISCNEIINGYDASYVKSGYLIDLPNGGEEHILNNTIAQGTYNGGQKIFIAFAAEGAINTSQTIELKGNTLINDLGQGTFLNMFHPATSTPNFTGNLLVGGGTISNTSVNESNDQTFASRSTAGISATGFPRSTACPSALGLMTVSK